MPMIVALPQFIKNAFSAKVAEKNTYLPFVDGLRGLAVLMVVLSHTSQHLGSGGFHFALTRSLTEAGDRGVQLFFILSAFTLFSSSLVRFKRDSHPTRNFYIRRMFRILPFWWVIVAFWALYYHPHFYQILPSILFVFGFLRFDGALEIVPGGWTLFVEETFYLLLPLLFSKINSLWRATGLFVALWVVGDIWLTEASKIDFLKSSQFVFFAPLSHWFAFGLGIVGYYLVRHELFKHHVISNRSAWPLIDALALGGAWIYLNADFRAQTIALFIIFIAAFLEGGLISKVMRTSLLMRFGRYCYSIYLLQFALLLLLDPFRNWLFQILHIASKAYEIRLLIYYPVILIILLIVSFVTFNLIEKPCIDLGKRLIVHLTERKHRRQMAAEENPQQGIDEAKQF
jgi:peptidoglycan/LPS O-acetylase OafA/YrhL